MIINKCAQGFAAWQHERQLSPRVHLIWKVIVWMPRMKFDGHFTRVSDLCRDCPKVAEIRREYDWTYLKSTKLKYCHATHRSVPF
jgi:hypothetical protein